MKRSTAITASSVTAIVLFVGGALGPMRAGTSTAEVPTTTAQVDALAPTAASDDALASLRDKVAANGTDAKLHAQLGVAYLQKARAEADPSALPLAEAALRRSLELAATRNLEAFIGMASLANARHEFFRSVRWSRRAIETNPYSAAAYGLLGDALFELGRVRAADAAYQEMVERRPDVASYVRASYALQYHGRTRAAIAAMRLALQAAGPVGETAAWVRHQMGDLYAGLKDNAEAARQNRMGIAIAPGYIPPTVGLAESYIATQRLEDALALMQSAALELPSIEYMITLGDLYRATGRESEAGRQYHEVAAKLNAYRQNGVRPDADFIIFYADHGLRPAAAVREALSMYRSRPTPKTADALAWMLHAVGRDRAAWRYAREVTTFRGSDSQMLFHAGMIAAARGDDETARAVMRRAIELDPAFSVVQAPVARRLAAGR